jgi:hypothetical protein
MTMTIESLIRAADPVADSQYPVLDEEFARRLLADIVATPVRRSNARRPRVVSALVTAGLCVVVVAAVVLSGLAGRPTPAAAAVLLRLSNVAATLPAVDAPLASQYQYTNSLELTPVEWVYEAQYPYFVNYVSQRQIWVSSDGSGRLVQTWSDPTFPTAHDRKNWILSGSHSLAQASVDQTSGPGTLVSTPTNLWTLPTDPSSLMALITSRKIEYGPPGPREDFEQVGDLLPDTDAPPAVRAALFQVAAQIPGVQLLGPTKDHLGRTGVAVAYPEAPMNRAQGAQGLYELIFDPTTSVLLGDETVVINPVTGARTITNWTSYVASAVVNSTTAVVPSNSLGQ